MANVGVINPEQIIKNSLEYNKQGIDISTIGVGYGVNYELLRQIAKNGKGANHYVGCAEDVQKVFIDEVESLLSPVAKEVSLDVEFENGLVLFDVYGYSPQIGVNKVHFEVDDINSSLTQIFLLKFDTKKINYGSEAKVKISFNFLDIKSNQRKTIGKNISVVFDKNSSEGFLKDREVKKNYSIAIMAQSLKEMALKYETGKFQESMQIIDNCLTEVYIKLVCKKTTR